MKQSLISIIYVLLLVIIIILSVNCDRKIPNYLEECYTNKTLSGPRLPMTLNVLIDIFRKVEIFTQTSVDLRLMVTSMLHRFKFDGIEYHEVKSSYEILPFSGTGNQRIKNQVVNEFIPGNPYIFPVEALSLIERCTLHRAISNTVADHNQPDSKLCTDRPTEKIYAKSSGRNKKLCPLEEGIILTEFGTVAPGTLIAAIAAALQHQNVAVKLLYDSIQNDEHDFNDYEVDFVIPKHEISLNKSMWFSSLSKSNARVDNIWLATIAGELAELVVYQGPIKADKMSLGSSGFWDSTMRPMLFFLLNKDDSYDVTRAEIVGAVDGFIIANSLKTWMSHFSNLRLSQIFDIYYSSKGAFFDSDIAACERGKVFWYHGSRQMLKEQTYAVSQVLAYKKSVSYMTDDALDMMVNYAVNKFTNYVNNNLFTELRCHKEKKYPNVEIFVAFDGSWSQEYTQDFLSVLIEDLNVSIYGSKIGILDGNTGKWILNTTNSSSTAYEIIYQLNSSISWPTNLNLSITLDSIDGYLTKMWDKKSASHQIGTLGQVILFLAPRTIVQSSREIKSSLNKLKQNHPDVNIIYYVSKENLQGFKDLLITPEDYLIDTAGVDDIVNYVMTIPRSLRRSCSKNDSSPRDQVEDYVRPRESIIYRLDAQWRRNTQRISMSVVSVGYGSFEVCWWTQLEGNIIKNKFDCRELSRHMEFIINDTQDCRDRSINCPAIYYQIRGLSSSKKCAEIECRTPEYIRYILRLSSQCSHAPVLSYNLFLLLLISINYVLS
ncbi:uncharacterized protein LOC103569388 [Microplitis demolitor]|uniref:uncharacterized protein LOC103569388 n=1 Tax=Microplitis demolitor TaxID=69319 RepID=UPI0004CCC26A|nr:uncharacterized protein LOC103569388 [Microplitis demolitor]